MDRITPWIVFIYLLCNKIFTSWDCIYMTVVMCPLAERRERLISVGVPSLDEGSPLLLAALSLALRHKEFVDTTISYQNLIGLRWRNTFQAIRRRCSGPDQDFPRTAPQHPSRRISALRPALRFDNLGWSIRLASVLQSPIASTAVVSMARRQTASPLLLLRWSF
jgi:hypothetical protein